jgi:hypothetical protein
MLQKMSDQNKILFLNEETSSKIEKKADKSSEKTLKQLSEEQKSKKLNSKDDGLMTSHHISSARTGDITDKGGPSKYLKSESSNTVWDSDKTAKSSKELDNKTKTIQEKEKIASNRREVEKKRMDDLAATIADTLQEKASSIAPAGTHQGSNYQLHNNNMSIFDKKDFQRLDDKTGGEKVSEDTEIKKSQKDESWKSDGKATSSKDFKDRFFDSLMGNKE